MSISFSVIDPTPTPTPAPDPTPTPDPAANSSARRAEFAESKTQT